MLSVWARLDLAMIGFAPQQLARGAKRVVVDIDPAEVRKWGPIVDLPICADAGEFLNEVLRQFGGRRLAGRPAWIDACNRWKQAYPIVLPKHRAETDFVSTYVLCDALSDLLDCRDVVVLTSSGAAIGVFYMSLREGRPAGVP